MVSVCWSICVSAKNVDGIGTQKFRRFYRRVTKKPIPNTIHGGRCCKHSATYAWLRVRCFPSVPATIDAQIHTKEAKLSASTLACTTPSVHAASAQRRFVNQVLLFSTMTTNQDAVRIQRNLRNVCLYVGCGSF